MMSPALEPITLLIVHWNRPQQCATTLKAFRAQGVSLRPIVLDNGSDISSFENLQREVGELARVVRFEQNLGWGPALNVALKEWLQSGEGDLCLISAHDAELSPGCVELLVQAMRDNSRLGIACPQYADRTIPRLTVLHGVRLETIPARPRGAVQPIDVPHGTVMLMRRSCLQEIGLFDERYFAYGDEHEIGARARREGWEVGMVWGAVVGNPETTTPAAWRTYLFSRNSLLLVYTCFGRMAAWSRSLGILLTSTRPFRGSAAADANSNRRSRYRGVRDYFLGRFGPPAW